MVESSGVNSAKLQQPSSPTKCSGNSCSNTGSINSKAADSSIFNKCSGNSCPKADSNISKAAENSIFGNGASGQDYKGGNCNKADSSNQSSQIQELIQKILELLQSLQGNKGGSQAGQSPSQSGQPSGEGSIPGLDTSSGSKGAGGAGAAGGMPGTPTNGSPAAQQKVQQAMELVMQNGDERMKQALSKAKISFMGNSGNVIGVGGTDGSVKLNQSFVESQSPERVAVLLAHELEHTMGGDENAAENVEKQWCEKFGIRYVRD